jgi:hypothetical protein
VEAQDVAQVVRWPWVPSQYNEEEKIFICPHDLGEEIYKNLEINYCSYHCLQITLFLNAYFFKCVVTKKY